MVPNLLRVPEGEMGDAAREEEPFRERSSKGGGNNLLKIEKGGAMQGRKRDVNG